MKKKETAANFVGRLQMTSHLHTQPKTARVNALFEKFEGVKKI